MELGLKDEVPTEINVLANQQSIISSDQCLTCCLDLLIIGFDRGSERLFRAAVQLISEMFSGDRSQKGGWIAT